MHDIDIICGIGCGDNNSLVVKPSCIGAIIRFVPFFVVLFDQDCFLSTLQYHCLKLGSVLTNYDFITGGGDVVSIGHCCGFVRGQVGWCGEGAVGVGVLLGGGCLG